MINVGTLGAVRNRQAGIAAPRIPRERGPRPLGPQKSHTGRGRQGLPHRKGAAQMAETAAKAASAAVLETAASSQLAGEAAVAAAEVAAADAVAQVAADFRRGGKYFCSVPSSSRKSEVKQLGKAPILGKRKRTQTAAGQVAANGKLLKGGKGEVVMLRKGKRIPAAANTAAMAAVGTEAEQLAAAITASLEDASTLPTHSPEKKSYKRPRALANSSRAASVQPRQAITRKVVAGKRQAAPQRVKPRKAKPGGGNMLPAADTVAETLEGVSLPSESKGKPSELASKAKQQFKASEADVSQAVSPPAVVSAPSRGSEGTAARAMQRSLKRKGVDGKPVISNRRSATDRGGGVGTSAAASTVDPASTPEKVAAISEQEIPSQATPSGSRSRSRGGGKQPLLVLAKRNHGEVVAAASSAGSPGKQRKDRIVPGPQLVSRSKQKKGPVNASQPASPTTRRAGVPAGASASHNARESAAAEGTNPVKLAAGKIGRGKLSVGLQSEAGNAPAVSNAELRRGRSGASNT